MSKSFFNTRAMLVTSRPNKKQRSNLVWIAFVPTGDNNDTLSANENLKTRIGNDLSQGGPPKPGKVHYRCKIMRRFGCTHQLRSFKSDTTGEATFDKHGTHVRDFST